jgi:hypothetical protein
MVRAEEFISGLYYGFDLERIYFRIDAIFRNRNYLQALQFCIQFLTPQEWEIVFPVIFPEGEKQFFILYRRSEKGPEPLKRFSSIYAGQIIELSLPFTELCFHPNDKANFFLRVERGDLEVERYPRTGYLSLVIPDRDFENTLWQV